MTWKRVVFKNFIEPNREGKAWECPRCGAIWFCAGPSPEVEPCNQCRFEGDAPSPEDPHDTREYDPSKRIVAGFGQESVA
jgi:predicted RNA-binding Zn-ribbon protein involved in translation (DUF1610 family)